jgi:uncharacterized protein (DUF427 family)
VSTASLPENVWDYPRPPRLERVPQRLRIVLGGETIADTTAGWRVLETSHPPTYYLPQDAFRPGALIPSARRTFCEWKGDAVYWTITGGGRTEHDAGWSYPDPTPDFAAIRDHVAVYAGRMEACFVDDEQVTPQHGHFYGGWITSNLVGPFKGGPDSYSW